MRAPYLLARGGSPLPSLGGSRVRPRPVIPVLIGGPSVKRVTEGLLDSGSDETVFEDSLAAMLGIDLTRAEERQVALAGRPGALRCRYETVELRIGDRREAFQWNAVVGFVSGPLAYSLLGYAGFLQFFDVEFRGADQQVQITPNASFPGRRL